MKVIEGGFGKGEEGSPVTLKESIQQALLGTKLDEKTEGSFILLLDTKERMTFATNEVSAPVLIYMLETAKHLILTGAINE